MRHRPAGGTLSQSETALSDESGSILPFANGEGDLMLLSQESLGIGRRLLVRPGTVSGRVGPAQAVFSGGEASASAGSPAR